MIYLDYNATTPCDPRVKEAMLPYLEVDFANPSSLHTPGQKARKAIEESRQKIAELINARAEEIIFTSGGTEANNLAIKGIAYRKKKGHIITSSIEHPAVLRVCKELQKEGFKITFLRVDQQGVVDPEDVRKAITKDTILISIMHVNNETGAIQPIEEIAKISKEHEIPFHADCVQSIGKIPVDLKAIGVNLASASAHKFYGPKGIGFLYLERGIRLAPQVVGGHQERGIRGGTENVPGIVGLGKAMAIAYKEMSEEISKIRALRDTLERGLKESIPEIKIVSERAPRIHNTSLVLVKHVEGESMLLSLDFEGICVSSGSACTSGSLEPSHVLLACGVPPEEAHGSLRFSLGKYTTETEIKTVLEVFPKIVEKLRSFSPFKI